MPQSCASSGLLVRANLLALVCLVFVVAYSVMVFGPSLASSPEHFPDKFPYFSLGRELNPLRRLGFFGWCLMLFAIAACFANPRCQTGLSGESKVSKIFISLFAVSCLVASFFFRPFSYLYLSGLPLAFLLWKRPQLLLSKTVLVGLLISCLSSLAFMTYVQAFISPNMCFAYEFPEAVNDFENHNSFVFSGPVDRLTAGYKLAEGVLSPYGLVFQYALAFWQKQFGILSWGAEIKLLGFVQIVALVLSSFCYAKYAGRHLVFGVIAVALLLPVFPNLGLCILFPNVSFLRFFGFLLTICYMLFLAPRLGVRLQAVCAGLIGGTAILMNLETGLLSYIGLLLYCVSQRSKLLLPKIGVVFSNLILFAIGIAGSLLLFELFVFLGLGYTVPLTALFENFKEMMLLGAGGGTSGHHFEPFVIPVIAACHSGYVFVLLLNRACPLRRREAFTASISLMNILWMIYYFNTPRTVSFDFCYLMYLFLFIDLMRIVCISTTFKKRQWLYVLPVCISLVLVTDAAYRWKHFVDVIRRQEKIEKQFIGNSEVVCGIRFPLRQAEELKRRANYLKSEQEKFGKVVYFTINSVLMPKISGVQSDIQRSDLYFSYIRTKDGLRLVNNLAKSRVQRVLVDAPNIIFAGTNSHKMCIGTFRMLLGQFYRMERVEDGWEIWVLKDDSSVKHISPE